KWSGRRSAFSRETRPVAFRESGSGRFLVFEGFHLPASATSTGPFRGRFKVLAAALLVSALGCSHEGYISQQGLEQRILPPPNSQNPDQISPPNKPSQDSAGGNAAQAGQTKPEVDTSAQSSSASSSQRSQISGEADQPLTLAAAVDVAFRLQPRLRASLESI